MHEWISVAVSLAAFFVACVSYLRTTAAARAEVFLQFRKRFSEIKASIPPWYDAPTIPASATKEELRAAELYWQNAFDQWFVTSRLEPWHLGKLWRRFYKGIMTLSLKNNLSLRAVAADLTHESAEFGEYQDEFRAVLNELCLRATNIPLCGKESCPKCGRQR